MKKYRGIAVSEGYALGPVREWLPNLPEAGTFTHTQSPEKDRPREWARFLQARVGACSHMTELYQQALARVGEHYAGIFKIQLALLQDEELLLRVRRKIMEEGLSAEVAMQAVGEEYGNLFDAMDDEYMRARGADIRDVQRQVLQQLAGDTPLGDGAALPSEEDWPAPYLLAADDILPSQTLALDPGQVLGLILRQGSQMSHAAILARSLGIPAVTGVRDFPRGGGFFAILNGFSGELLRDPGEEEKWEYTRMRQEFEARRQALKTYSGVQTITMDGTPVELMANIGHPDDMTSVRDCGADGIGLFRSEYLFMYCEQMPSEEEQAAAYSAVLQQMQGKKVIIRLLDVGADKQIPYVKMDREENPVMGRRGIRFCLEHRDILMTQLRALLRAAPLGQLGILIPMVVSVEEVRTVRRLLRQAACTLEEEGIAHSTQYEIGVMIETPASVMMGDELAQEVDFFSIGTNDLTQFVMAADLGNPKVGALCSANQEPVRRMLRMAVDSARRAGIWADVCGEAAADPQMTEFLLSIGVRTLSVAPASLLSMRQTIRQQDLTKKSGES